MRKSDKIRAKDWFGRHRNLFFIIFAGFFLFLFVTEHLKANEIGEPGKFIMYYVDKGLSVLNDPIFKEKPNERKTKLWNEISSAFNFPEMCKRTISHSKWRGVSVKNREEFITLLTKVVKDTFLARLDYFSGKCVKYVGEVQVDKRAKVQCDVTLNTGKRITVSYGTLLLANDNWVIYDVIIEGVSVVNNYRRQFDYFLRPSSFDELLSKLK
ncbi:MAG: MlaC/ttg2D family ABC transporter substrate-binding protein [Candidatus Anammoxibacter sp.]